MTGQVLKDHAIGIDGDRISYILPIPEAPHDPEVIDLPHTTLLPGFVNAHCHLDLSHLKGKVPYTGSFTEWIQKIVTLRKHEGDTEIRAAALELINSGVTSVMDHAGVDPTIANLMSNPLRKWVFLEVIGFTPDTAAAAFVIQRDRADEAQRQGDFAIPSPHAPYSLTPEVFSAVIASAAKQSRSDKLDCHAPPSGARNDILSVHCAEGAEEWEMFTEGKGKLWEFVKSLATPPLRIRGGAYNSPIQYLAAHHLLPSQPWLAVHCNTLTDGDIASLKKSHATVVHCPRSHRFFNHPPFPLERLRAAGVPVAIGTDSLASCPNFNFLEELRTMREEFAFLTTDEILHMACSPLTPALSPKGRGGLSVGAFADIIGLPQQNDLLSGSVTFSIIGGKRVI